MADDAAAALAGAPPPAAAADGDGDDQRAPQPSRSSCEVCGNAEVKYCCPKCSKKTCSLACVKSHKEESQCSGKRDRAAFVGRGQLDERSLLRDYRFLEEVKLAEDVAKRSKPPAPKAELPAYLQSLLYQARRRGVQLHILPPGMQGRRANTTRYDGRQQRLWWRVEWSFGAAGCRAANARVDEDSPLEGVLAAHLVPPAGSALKSPELQEYADVGLERLTVALRKERTPANELRYYRIDVRQPLRRQLEGKVVVEFPTLLVLLPREVEGYEFVEGEPQQQPGEEAPPAPADAPPPADAGAAR